MATSDISSSRQVRDTIIEYRLLIAVCIVVSAIVCYFNYDSGAQGIFKYYLCFRDTIAGGFDLPAHGCDSTTFPMWGYGWLLLLTQSKPILLALQCGLSIAAVIYFLSVIRVALSFSDKQHLVLKYMVILSLPWYALNSVLWPHAVATALLWIFLALLIKAHSSTTPRLTPWILSGLCFGILLNFRSDYILLPVGLLPLIMLFSHRPLSANLRYATAWLTSVILMMVPWGIYTTAATNNYLQTSTNGGHVLYIGLGQLPGNKWGITPRDGDPSMAAFLKQELGHPSSSLTYEADIILKARFRELVIASPAEYARKVMHNLKMVLISGTYAGAFHEQEACQPNCLGKYINTDQPMKSQGEVARSLLTGQASISPGLSATEYLRLALLGVSVSQSMLVTFLGFLLAIILIPYCLITRNAPMLFILAVVGYQLTLGSFTFFMRTYSSSVYLLLLVIIVFAAGLALRTLSSMLPVLTSITRPRRADNP